MTINQKTTAKVLAIFHSYIKLKIKNEILKVKFYQNLDNQNSIGPKTLLIGDLVDVSWINNEYVISKIHLRKNYLIRPHCTNIDYVVIIYSLAHSKHFFSDLLWWILMYQIKEFDVIVVFSKSDLTKNELLYSNDLHLLDELNVAYFDYHQEEDLNKVLNLLKNKFVILAGYSGVGKSTFLNFLDKDLTLKTNELSLRTQRGKHTTTNSTIYEVQNILIADTPGFTTLNWFLTKDELAFGWTIFKHLQTKCKFSNCLHDKTNLNCAVVKAVENKIISKKLYQIYLSFLKQVYEHKNNYSKK